MHCVLFICGLPFSKALGIVATLGFLLAKGGQTPFQMLVIVADVFICFVLLLLLPP